jgi:hypothetical protein
VGYPDMDDPIGDAIAVLIETMEEHENEAPYRDPMLAARIRRVRTALEDLQFHIDESADSADRAPKHT